MLTSIIEFGKVLDVADQQPKTAHLWLCHGRKTIRVRVKWAVLIWWAVKIAWLAVLISVHLATRNSYLHVMYVACSD